MFFFFNDTATTEIYTLSLHDALPISLGLLLDQDTTRPDSGVPFASLGVATSCTVPPTVRLAVAGADRKSTRLNSSHGYISYAVFCLKKKTGWWEAGVRDSCSSRAAPC